MLEADKGRFPVRQCAAGIVCRILFEAVCHGYIRCYSDYTRSQRKWQVRQYVYCFSALQRRRSKGSYDFFICTFEMLHR